jgi:hypothetical protein
MGRAAPTIDRNPVEFRQGMTIVCPYNWRICGQTERPPVGPAAVPFVVLGRGLLPVSAVILPRIGAETQGQQIEHDQTNHGQSNYEHENHLLGFRGLSPRKL